MKANLINIREKDAALYPIFAEWWTAHGWAPVNIAVLPKCGILITTDHHKPVMAAWLYMDNSTGVAMMEWTVGNPDASGREIYTAIARLVVAVKEVAASLDYGFILTTAKQHTLARCFERNGFTLNENGMTHLSLLTKEGS